MFLVCGVNHMVSDHHFVGPAQTLLRGWADTSFAFETMLLPQTARMGANTMHLRLLVFHQALVTCKFGPCSSIPLY